MNVTKQKLASIVLASSLILAFAGCGNSTEPPQTAPQGEADATGSELALVKTYDVVTCDTLPAGSVGRSDFVSQPGDDTFATPLQPEAIGTVHTLPAQYPDGWIVVHDANFPSMIDGRFLIIDAAADIHALKASVHGGKIGSVDIAPERNELYVATTYYSRGVSGERTDIIAVHDTCTLGKKAEIEIPAKLASATPTKNRFRLSEDGRFGFAFNFTPAASVSVVDLVSREVLNEVEIPGCSLVYPMGERSFASACGDGTLLGAVLDEQGQLVSQDRSESVVDFDTNAMFLKGGKFGGEIYFPTFAGSLLGFDLSGDVPVFLGDWSLLSQEEKQAGWRPGGWHLVASDVEKGELFVLMHTGGREGSHKNPGSEVWVYDIETKERVRRMPLRLPAISIGLAGDMLTMVTVESNIDVYDVATGDFRRTIAQTALAPLLIYTPSGE